jgi:hypothetical protein
MREKNWQKIEKKLKKNWKTIRKLKNGFKSYVTCTIWGLARVSMISLLFPQIFPSISSLNPLFARHLFLSLFISAYIVVSLLNNNYIVFTPCFISVLWLNYILNRQIRRKLLLFGVFLLNFSPFTIHIKTIVLNIPHYWPKLCYIIQINPKISLLPNIPPLLHTYSRCSNHDKHCMFLSS